MSLPAPTNLRWYAKSLGAFHHVPDNQGYASVCGKDVAGYVASFLDDAAYHQASEAVRARDTRCRKCLRKLKAHS